MFSLATFPFLLLGLLTPSIAQTALRLSGPYTTATHFSQFASEVDSIYEKHFTSVESGGGGGNYRSLFKEAQSEIYSYVHTQAYIDKAAQTQFLSAFDSVYCPPAGCPSPSRHRGHNFTPLPTATETGSGAVSSDTAVATGTATPSKSSANAPEKTSGATTGHADAGFIGGMFAVGAVVVVMAL